MTSARWLLAARIGVVAWLLVVVWASLVPSQDVPGATAMSDKAWHALAYAVLGALGTLALRPPRPVLVLVAAIAIGLALELAQAATGYRTFDLVDLLADALGALAGVLVAVGVRRPLPR